MDGNLTDHLMIDLETWSLERDAVIRAGVFIMFDAHGIGEALYLDARPSIDDQLENNRKISQSTHQWWLKQLLKLSDIIDTHRLQRTEVTSTYQIADTISSFLDQHKPRSIWSRHNMDLQVIRDLFSSLDLNNPWNYNQERDCSSFDDMLPAPHSVVPHDPYCDCLAQIEHTQNALSLTVDVREITEFSELKTQAE
ncbi:MAG: 3'-5' exoribonuclease [Candidatus Thiodiazotropha taylori]